MRGRAALVLLVLALSACAAPAPSGTSAFSGFLPATFPVATVAPATPVVSAAPAPTAALPPLALPNPGGTCSVGQIVVGKVVGFGGYAALGYADWFVRVPLKNVGGDCVLHLPTVLGVAPATGPFSAVSVTDAGTTTAAGDNSPKQSATIRAGHSLSIVLGDSWYLGDVVGQTAPPCLNPVSDVARITFPLAIGSLQIELPTVGGRAPFKEVCSSPASMTANIDLGRSG